MHIDHVALWTTDLDRCTRFYAHYLGITVGQKFGNAANGFESQFLTLESGARIEVMTTTALSPIRLESGAERMGYTHMPS
jgi:lactoylglutathione lyase